MEEEEESEYSTSIRTYTKVELAMMYNPDQCVDNALHTLSKWIRYNEKLSMELNAIGYNKFRRSFTPLEVRLLFKYLGVP
jgi:hypothetical protein